MIYSTTISKKGQITIPKPIRDFLGLLADKKVFIELVKPEKVLKIEPLGDFLDFAKKIKVKKNKNVDPVKAREYMETHYERI